ncbi:uncharacterized protein RHO17_000389 [Thomomys bottae]
MGCYHCAQLEDEPGHDCGGIVEGLRTKLVSFDDVAVDFSWQEWQILNNAQRTMYRDVMLDTYSNFVSLGHCFPKPELIAKLEQGTEPWGASDQNFTGIQKMEAMTQTCEENPDECVCEVESMNSNTVVERMRLLRTFKLNSKRKPYLSLHEQTHTGEKPFECMESDKYFTLKSDLNVHTRNHTEKKPYECDKCGKTFMTKSQLDMDNRIHTSEKPYECNICGKSFRLKSYLNLHQRIHTAILPESSVHCQKQENMRRSVKLVSFDDVAVDFSWQEWQILNNAQRTMYRDVMLDTYSNFVSLAGHCFPKPELIAKLEQGTEPWGASDQNFTGE